MVRRDAFEKASSFEVTDLWTGESARNESGKFEVKALAACDNVTVKVTPYA
ncbi:MAG: hypothetical protein J6X14_08285 [Lachnospiraceae bacterium]|nr:hypothetical protein [Lachnospiraceae bacterium]